MVKAIQENRQATVSELSQLFNVSEVTIRRDLLELANQGELYRVHGGAIAVSPSAHEPPVVKRMGQMDRCKLGIAHAAARLISDGDSVFIGSGSTSVYVARQLTDRKDLTVITNALTVATELASAAGVTVVVTGGMMRPSELSLIGHITEQALLEVRVDKIIIGIPAISVEHGLTNDYLPEVMTDRTIIEMASELILVADHTKFGKVGMAFVAPLTRVTSLVTDSEADEEMLATIEDMGVRVIVAEI
jgi:DeoR/GlpR family transcriptional regulator of sugar metabolism